MRVTSRSVIGVIAAIVWLAAAPPPALIAQRSAGVSITGTVMIAGDRGPARRAELTLTGSAYPSGAIAISDDEGRYEFGNVAPGQYALTAVKPGFVSAYYGSTRPGRGPGVRLDVRDAPVRADLTMLPGAVISGTTRNHFNRASAATITALQQRVVNGEIVLQSAQSVTANATGDYRLYGLAPGRYFVVSWNGPGFSGARTPTESEFAAVARAGASPVAPMSAGNETLINRDVVYAPTMYPGVTDPGQAIAIEVAAGEERSGIDITARLVPSARLDARVVDPAGQTPRNLQLSLITPEQRLGFQNRELNGALRPAGVVVTKDGAFTRSALAPGRYTFLARAVDAMDSPLWAMTDIDVNGTDIPDLVIPLERALTVAGRIVFDRSPGDALPDSSKAQVRLLPSANVALGVAPMRAKPDGTFNLTGVAGGSYRVDVVLEGWTLASVRRGNDESIDADLVLRSGQDVPDLVITLTNRGPAIAGRLLDANDEPATAFSIVLLPVDPAHWRATSRLVRLARPSTDGRYAIDGLSPGEYFIAAISDGDGFDFNEPGVFEMLAATALRVRLSEHERRALDLRVGGK